MNETSRQSMGRARALPALAAAPLTLQAQTATLFNDTFAEGKAFFKAGDPLGALSFTAQGQ